VFSSVLQAHRAIEVFDLHEMIEVLAAFQGTRLPKGRGISVITASGGQAELLLDQASACGLDLPPLPPEQRAQVERVIGHVTGDGNPLDAWGSGDVDTNMPLAFEVLNAAPDIDAVVFCNDTADDQPMGREGLMDRYTELTARFAKASEKPHYMLKTRPGVMNAKQIAALRCDGVPIIEGIGPGLMAIDRLARYATFKAHPLLEAASVATPAPRTSRTSVNEVDAKRMLADFGVPVVRETLCTTEAQAIAAADAIGYPVVLKAVSDDIPHKSEYGLVAVNLADHAALSQAWSALQRRAIDADVAAGITGYVVQQMISGGVEVFAGVTRDAEFGHVLAFGLGGIMIEVLRDFAIRPLPLREGDAAAMVREIRAFPVLDGARGTPVADVPALVACLEALARFTHANRGWIAELDLNPIKVLPSGQGCVAVDALITPQRTP
jgi:acyl-CoA synthetase (NDP forming)